MDESLFNRFKVRLNLVNSDGTESPTDDKPLSPAILGATLGNQTRFYTEINWDENSTLENRRIKIELDPDNVMFPSSFPREKVTFSYDPVWTNSKPMKIYLVPVKYIYEDSGINYYCKMEDSRSDSILTPSPNNISLTSFITKFTNSVKGIMPVSWNQIDIVSNLGVEVVWDEVNGATNTIAVNNTSYGQRPTQSNPLDPLLGPLKPAPENYWEVQWARLTNGALDYLNLSGAIPEFSSGNAIPANTYLMLLLPRVPGHTLPTTAPLAWSDGGVQWSGRGQRVQPPEPMQPKHFGSMHANNFDTIFHEFSHELGALHAPFWSGRTQLPGDQDPDWPMAAGCTTCAGAEAYKAGAIGVSGWDATSNTPYDARWSKDLMTYPGLEGGKWAPRWASDWLFELAWRHQNNPSKPGPKIPTP
jgi:hypothetical protein